MADIFVFGDSIGFGAWDKKGGWVDRLKQHFMEMKLLDPQSLSTEIYNLSVDGDTSEDVKKRITSELSARRKSWSTSNDIVLVAIGTNDVYAEGSPENFKFTENDYRKNLQNIYDSVNSLGLRVAFISLDPVDEERTNPCSWGAYYWTNQRIQQFNTVLSDFCLSNRLPFHNGFDRMLELPNFKDLMFDGAHPDTEGHRWMYEQIKPFVVELLKK